MTQGNNRKVIVDVVGLMLMKIDIYLRRDPTRETLYLLTSSRCRPFCQASLMVVAAYSVQDAVMPSIMMQ